MEKDEILNEEKGEENYKKIQRKKIKQKKETELKISKKSRKERTKRWEKKR